MNIYSRREIAQILQGLRMVDLSAEKAQAPETTRYLEGYHDGFGAALVSVALAIGYGPEINPWRSEGPIWIEIEEGD